MDDIRVWLPVVLYNIGMMVVTTAALIATIRLRPRWTVARSVLTPGLVLLLLGAGGALAAPVHRFTQMQLLAWTVFLYGPVYLLVGSGLVWRKSRKLALFGFAMGAVVLLIALDAFVIEPRWLEETHLTIAAPGLPKPIRIVLVADIQTDKPGAYEEDALRRAMAAKPDLLLFGGDYVQILNEEGYIEGVRKMNAIMRRVGLSAPMGIYAVGGNIDPEGLWESVFSGLDVVTVNETRAFDLGPVVLTAMGGWDSFDTEFHVPEARKYHIVLGHAPEHAMGPGRSDLILAGHVHGGQVRLPFIGPILNLSNVRRDWAVGHTEIASNRHLVVSRGIGMERVGAPRLRFLCRPEFTVIDLLPAP